MEMRFPLILDGATGTQLQKRGYQGDVSAEQWVLDHPDSIQDIQRRYVQAGSRVQKGDVLFIVESMKLMNEVLSEYDGTVREILVQDGQPLEYGQPVMVLD